MSNQRKMILHQFIQHQVEKGVIKQEEQELYRYGYQLMVMQMTNLVIVVLIGLLFCCLNYMLLFVAVYIPLRSFAGGYHAKTAFRCTLISAGLELILAILLNIPEIQMQQWWLIAATALSVITILYLAPVEAKNKPLNLKERARYKKRTFYCIGAGILVWSTGVFTEMWKVSFVISICYIMTAVFMVIESMRKIQSQKG